MDYGQRESGIFVRQNLIPQADLQAEHVYQGGQIILPGIHQTLATLVGQTLAGPRLVQLDSVARQMVSPGPSKVLNLIAPRTDIANFTSPVLNIPEFTAAILVSTVTAVSGTTPSLTVQLQASDSQGSYSTQNGGTATSAQTTTGRVSTGLSISAVTPASMAGLLPKIVAVITGTTPSFTYYVDLIYK